MPDKEEEYQFASDKEQSDGTVVEEGQYIPSHSDAVNPELTERARRIALAVMIIIVGFVVYHFWGGKKEDKKEPDQSVAAVANAVQSQATTNAAGDTTQLKTTPPEVKAPLSKEEIALSKQVAELKQVLMADDSRVHHLELVVRHLEESVSNMTDAMSDVNLRVKAMLKKIQILEKRSIKAKSNKILINRPVSSRPKRIYTLTAVVSGRAWIRDNQGNELTVALGDRVPSYGKVRLINPSQGIVVTTSGRVITYGRDDA